MKFIVLDTETANYEPTSICQLGIVVLEDFKISQRIEYLIKPYPNQFISSFTKLHGITEDMVKDAPTFDIVWEKIKDLFEPFVPCVAHNASFDFGNIKSILQHYNYDTDNISFPILCTMQYAQHSAIKFKKYSLEYLCGCFDIENKRAHTALSDALATSELFIKLIELNNDELGSLLSRAYKYSFSECKIPKSKKSHRRFNHVAQKDIAATNEIFDETHILFGKTVVITGELDHMSRSEAYLAIKNVGGLCGDSVTKKTNYLVTNSDAMTGKMKKALQYKEQGQNIMIINEIQLYDLVFENSFIEEYNNNKRPELNTNNKQILNVAKIDDDWMSKSKNPKFHRTQQENELMFGFLNDNLKLIQEHENKMSDASHNGYDRSQSLEVIVNDRKNYT